ncbi:MAG TPA: ABC transporter ATP-binding protein [Spirochaetia bacterium]|nr:ABC transporter ATP-binding protein [Spirochaetia bacterium]
MGGYSDEKILKSYDPALIRRLFIYLRPYRLAVFLAVFSLLLSTAGEMIVPVLIRNSVDQHILPYYRRIVSQDLEHGIEARLASDPRMIRLEGDFFIPVGSLAHFTMKEKQEMTRKGQLTEPNYLIVTYTSELEETVRQRPELFAGSRLAGSGGKVAIREQDLKSMGQEQVRAIRNENFRGLARVAVHLLIALIGILTFTFAQIYLMAYVGQMVMKDIRTELYDHTINLSLKFIDSNPVGRIVTRLTNDVETVNELFTTVISSFLKDVSLIIGIMVTLFILNPRLAAISLSCLPIVIAASYLYRTAAREAFRRVRLAVSSINSFLSEHISGISVVQTFTREDLSREEFRKHNRSLLRANLQEMYVFATFRPLIDVIATTFIAVILYFGASSFIRNLVSLGVLIAFFNLMQYFFNPVRDLSEKYSLLQSAMAGSERVFNLLDEKSRAAQPSRSAHSEKTSGAIAFRDVGFSYRDGEWVIRNLSFNINPGETVAIVGYTGAGKSTIISLLTRLWEIQEGAILLDDVDIREIRTEHLRRRIQSVPQDVFLFSDSIEENIRLGSTISYDEVVHAARLVKADTFIERLPEGFATILQERGVNLSTGQRQLLSFARVVAHNPDVLVMDEATANIDAETEALIQQALDVLLKGRTALIIAHRLSTIRKADRILVLHQGKLVETGNHAELLKKKGLYYNLYKMQFEVDQGS